MPDIFDTHTPGLTSPAMAATAIVPNDATPLTHVTRAIYVGGPVNLSVVMLSGDIVTLAGVQAGVVYPLRASGVRATGTTATGLVGLR
jgi:hypothetical protein